MERPPFNQDGGEQPRINGYNIDPPERETTNDSAAETEPRYHPLVEVVDLASAARGISYSLWIDAHQDPDELDADIAAMLDSSPTLPGLPWEKAWSVARTEEFAGLTLQGCTDTALIARLAKGVADFGAAYGAYAELVGISDPEILDKFEDCFVGSYDSPEAWAKATAEDLEWARELDEALTDPFLRPTSPSTTPRWRAKVPKAGTSPRATTAKPTSSSGDAPGHSPVACGRSPRAASADMGGHTTPRRRSVVTDPSKNGTKTLGIKLPPGLHAQFSLVAQLDGINLTVAILRAVEQYVANKQAEPDFAKRAAVALAEIEEEAAARKAAIEGLFGNASPQVDAAAAPASDDPETAKPVATEPTKPSRTRGRKTDAEE
ncbi:hypothetical protein [Amycolatopsis sp. cmx-11-51]|uniref:hypothetical protein n=1 Tax=Amycolatopsis sp. cmx-11-51 TaxID=2785797 RepID=UPI0039E238A0